MPNNRFNKQVTPKGYQKGGAVKKPKVRKIGAVGVGKAKDYPGIKQLIKDMKKKGTRPKKAEGGRIYKAGGGLTEATQRLRRQGLGMGGKACIQIKGFGKARRPNK